MNKYKILKDEFNITDKSIEKLIEWEKIFIEYNSHTNLMSRNDVDYIFEKHVYDSLAILKWEDFYKFNNILDVGCGGGFPSVILAICFENKNIIANDSRIKKINFILKIKDELKLNNLTPLYNRIEQAQPQNADLILSRAMSSIINVFELSKHHLKKDGKFVFYKAKKTKDEIMEFKKKYPSKEFKIIPYTIPFKEVLDRNLVVL